MENFTQIPNIIFDEWMNKMSSSSFKVLMAICRKTIGWQKESDYISQSQIVKITGISKNSVIRALEELKAEGIIITKEKQGITTNYTLNLTSAKTEPVSELNQTSAKTEPEPVPKLNTQKKKETVSKENSPHHKIIKYFDDKYKEITGNKLAWIGRYFKDIDKLRELGTEEEIFKRLKILETEVRKSNNGYLAFTPDVAFQQWNKLYDKQNKETPVKKPSDNYNNGQIERMKQS